jgi:hypothetical protein
VSHPLSASDILRVWERGQQLHPVDRALLLLAIAHPAVPWEQLARLPVGQRNEQLLSLRESTFGPRLASFAQCSRCGERLEFEFAASHIRLQEAASIAAGSGEAGGTLIQEVAGYTVRFRLPDSYDLAAIASSTDVQSARNTLLDRCILSIEQNGELVERLPLEAEQLLSEYLSRADPQADVQLSLRCPNCGNEWLLSFDISSFFWTEINSLAKRLLREVHTLGRAYGWREAEILAMSAARRQAYLELVLG